MVYGLLQVRLSSASPLRVVFMSLLFHDERSGRIATNDKQEDDIDTLAVIASFLLFDGRRNEVVLRTMNEEGSFARLLDLLQAQNRRRGYDGAGIHRLLMDLLYEMSRIQRVRIEDLGEWFSSTWWWTLFWCSGLMDVQYSSTMTLSRVCLISSRISRTTSMTRIIIPSFGCW